MINPMVWYWLASAAIVVVCAVAINPLAAMLVHDFVESPSRRWLRHARLPRLSPRRPMATSIVARGGGVR